MKWVRMFFRHGGYTEFRVNNLTDIDVWLKANGYTVNDVKNIEFVS